MPFTSTQVSGLVGGQQVMFANQAAFANQISEMVSGGGSTQHMSNPYPSPSYGVAGLDPGSPDIGTKLAGGAAMALPGLAAGGSMAASLLGYKSPLGLLDPFTGISRGFGAGTGGGMMARAGVMAGAEGMGINYAFGNISGAFASGGLRAGLGAIGGGIAGAAATALPYYAAYKGIEYAGQQAYTGVQNFQDVRRMSSQYLEPQYGAPGARMGGAMGAGQVGQITSFMHELASEDVQTTMKDMRRLMDRAGQTGMLQGLGDVNQFKQRFRDIVKQTRGIAQILGTTLDEALPVTQKLQQMGMWTAKDVLGTAVAMKVAGPSGAPSLLGSVEQGAQMSYAMGGKLEAGGRLGRALYSQVDAATSAGIFSQQDIRNITGGVGGAEGQRMMAGSMQQVFAGFGQSAAGRLMMAGLGEFKGGEFTGRMDEQSVNRWRRGELNFQDLQRVGKQRTGSSKEAAVSFFNKADELGQEMAQKGGMVGMAQAVQQAMEHAGYAGQGKNIENRFIQLITGSNQRQADMIQKVIRELPRIQATEQERASAALEDTFNQMNERRFRSLSGLGDAVSKALHEGLGRPIQELAERTTSTMSEATERLTDKFMGRTRAIPRLSQEQRSMMAQAIAGGQRFQPVGVQNIGQDFMQGGYMENLITRFGDERSGIGGRIMGGAAAGAAIGAGIGVWGFGVGAAPGAVVGAAVGGVAGALTSGVGEDETPRMKALRAAGYSGGGYQEAERVARRAYIRQVEPSMGNLFGGETEEKRSAMETVKARMREIYNDPVTARRLAQLAKEDPTKQRDEILRLMKSGDSKAAAAFEFLEKATPGGAGATDAGLDVIAGAQSELNYRGKHALDLTQLTKGLPVPPSDPEEVKKYRQENIEKMSEALGGFSWKGLAKAAAPIALGPLGAQAAYINVARYVLGRGLKPSDIESAMASGKYSAQDIKDWTKGKGGRFAEALSQGDAAAEKIRQQFDASSEEEKTAFVEGLDKESGVKYAQYMKERTDKMKVLSTEQGPVRGGGGIGVETAAGLEKARKAFTAGDVTTGEQLISQVAGRQLGGREIDRLLSGRGGAVGQQAGRLALIGGMGEMDEAGFLKFRERMNLGGVDLMTPEIQEKVSKMLTDKKISGSEVTELKKMLTDVSGQALGVGAGGKTVAQEAQEKYITAITNFTNAVGKLAVVKAQDVKSDDPVAAKTE